MLIRHRTTQEKNREMRNRKNFFRGKLGKDDDHDLETEKKERSAHRPAKRKQARSSFPQDINTKKRSFRTFTKGGYKR